jgi:5'-deoxynucleotidase YfbR-like HD superfamily hydrolase
MSQVKVPEQIPKEVKRFQEFLARREPIDIGNLFIFLQSMVEAMDTRYRWETRARKDFSRESQDKGQQLFREKVSQHCYKTGFLAALMARIEQLAGNTDLDTGRLVLAGLLHDIPELLRGDNYYWQKTAGDEQAEQGEFNAITAGLAPELRDWLRDVYLITQPDNSNPYDEWTREQRFFKLVELVGYFKRALAECRAGNMNFASVFRQHWGQGFPHDPLAYKQEFGATVSHWFPAPIRNEIEKFAKLAPE